MAQKRMFDKAILDTDRFMDLPMSAKALYFLLGMEADDEGFVSYKKVIRIHGGQEDDIKLLIVKGFLIQFPSGVVVVTDWNKNNWIDSRRSKPTEYQKERKLLVLTDSKEYVLSHGLARVEESRVEYIATSLQENESPIQVVKETTEIEIVPKRPTKYPNARIVFGWFPSPQKSWEINTTELKHAELLFLRGEKQVKSALSFISVNSEEDYCPKITKPSDLERKWMDLVAFKKKHE